MLSYLLCNIICETFEKEVGRWQSNSGRAHNERRLVEPSAMLISFTIPQDEVGNYRSKELAIYGHQNYVQVWERDTTNRMRTNAIISDWKMLIDHDSEWRICINNWLFNNRNELTTFGFFGNWYKVVPWSFKNENSLDNKIIYK
jgi:hypothetical protein